MSDDISLDDPISSSASSAPAASGASSLAIASDDSKNDSMSDLKQKYQDYTKQVCEMQRTVLEKHEDFLLSLKLDSKDISTPENAVLFKEMTTKLQKSQEEFSRLIRIFVSLGDRIECIEYCHEIQSSNANHNSTNTQAP